MIKQSTSLRAVLTTLVALLVVASATFLLLPRAEAAQAHCGDGSGGVVTNSWQVTQDSLDRESANACPPGDGCKEWCNVSCGNIVPQGVFACFAQ